jgi:hypothetical protein
MLASVKDWEIPEEESCSDHDIIKYNLNFAYNKTRMYHFLGTRYVIKEQQHTDFHKILLTPGDFNEFSNENNEGNTIEIDWKLKTQC